MGNNTEEQQYRVAAAVVAVVVAAVKISSMLKYLRRQKERRFLNKRFGSLLDFFRHFLDVLVFSWFVSISIPFRYWHIHNDTTSLNGLNWKTAASKLFQNEKKNSTIRGKIPMQRCVSSRFASSTWCHLYFGWAKIVHRNLKQWMLEIQFSFLFSIFFTSGEDGVNFCWLCFVCCSLEMEFSRRL